jgi:glutamate-1-semialdehyde 2,1-aminomutase
MDEEKAYPKSAQAWVRAERFLAGGVNSPVRAFAGVDIKPLFIERAAGSKIYDIDGNEYIDYVGSWGPMILGHAHPKVLQAIQTAAKNGTSFGAPTLAETALAEKIVRAFDSIEKVRLVSSGTEAVMTAIRLARAYTKRDLIIKMAGCYHGHNDSLLVAAGSGVAEGKNSRFEIRDSKFRAKGAAGVPDSLARLTIVLPYNDIDAAKAAFARHKGKIAAVLIEPVAANMGVVPPVDGYLATLRHLCDRDGAILIFDEVITGFRVAYGGAQELFGIKADITCLGKIIGGGLPLAALGARGDIMDMLAPTGPVYQAGTLSGNPIATAAANATLDILEERPHVKRGAKYLAPQFIAGSVAVPAPASAGASLSPRTRGAKHIQRPAYQRLESSAAMLEAGLASAAKEAGVTVTINRVGSIMSCFFTDPFGRLRAGRPVRNFADVQSTNIKQFKRFFAHMLNQGVYLAPSAYEAMFVSLAHTQEDIGRTIEAARRSLGRRQKPEV